MTKNRKPKKPRLYGDSYNDTWHSYVFDSDDLQRAHDKPTLEGVSFTDQIIKHFGGIISKGKAPSPDEIVEHFGGVITKGKRWSTDEVVQHFGGVLIRDRKPSTEEILRRWPGIITTLAEESKTRCKPPDRRRRNRLERDA